MEVSTGNLVKVEYEGRLESGEIFDSSKHGDHSHPLEFVAGVGMVVKGFDDAVLGMKLNEEKEITIKPEEAYGMPDEKLQRKVPRSLLPQDQVPEVGMALYVETPQGPIPVKIVAVDKENITIDLNHPLAGKTLIFKIKVINIHESPEGDNDEISEREDKMDSERQMFKAKCSDCGADCEVPFKPTEGKPVRCRDCFAKNRPQRSFGGGHSGGGRFGGGRRFGGGDRGPRQMFKATCADCGQECEVPFKPTQGKPVRCKECFAKSKGSTREDFGNTEEEF